MKRKGSRLLAVTLACSMIFSGTFVYADSGTDAGASVIILKDPSVKA